MATSRSSGSTPTVISRQVRRNACELFYVLHDTRLALSEKLELMTELLDGDNVNVNLADDRDGQNTLLHGAVLYGYVDIVKLLLEKGADVSSKNIAGETPFSIAQAKSLVEIVNVLVNKDAKDKNTADKASLHKAVASGDVKSVKLLLEKGTDATIKNTEGENLLHVAVSKGFVGIVTLLLERNPGIVNVKNATGNTALHLSAALRGRNRFKIGADLVNLILKFNADVNIENDEGKTPLCLAVEQNAESVVKLLREHKDNAGNDTSTGDGSGLENEDVISIDGFEKNIETIATVQSDHDKSESTPQDKANLVCEPYRPKPGPYKTSGAKTSSHGTLYQLRLLLCFLLRAMNNDYVFRLGTEVTYAEQFDDLVFEYRDKESGLERKLFLQAKHVQNNTKKIVISDLLSHKDKAPFSLLKYYKSYLKVKETFGPEADKIDLALCTNIHLSLDEDCKILEAGSERQLEFTEVTEPYKEFFKEGKCYKLVTDNETLTLFSSEYQTYVTKAEQQWNEITLQEISNVTEGSVNTLPSNEPMQLCWDFNTFLNNLIFVVKQPADDDNVKTELISFGSTKHNDINLLYDSFYMKMYDWSMKKEGTYLTDELVKDMIQKIVNNLDIVSISGISKVYAEKLLTTPVAFNASKLDVLLEMISKHNIVHLFSNIETKLTGVQVAQALHQSDVFKTGDKFIFVRLDSLLLNRTQNLVANAFKSPDSNDLLVIDCLATTKTPSKSGSELTNLSEYLLSIVKENPKKKIVFIAPEDHPLPAMFNDCTRHHVTSVFQDLTPESQAELLATSVTLQGQSVELSQVIDKDDKDLLDLVPLEDLISDEGLVIGTELPTYHGYDESFYIERSVIHRVHVNAKIFQAISEKKFNDHVVKTESEFQQFCTTYPGANIHLLREENGRFIWVKSEGELNALRQYIDRNNSQSCAEDEFLKSVKDQRIVIISDTAGMGKSTILSHISKQIKDNLPGKLVFRVDLNNSSEELNKRKSSKFDKSSAMDFLCDTLIKIKTSFEKELLEREGKVVLLFDGFDEISPDYDDVVIDLIQNIEEVGKAQIWITTPYENLLLVNH